MAEDDPDFAQRMHFMGPPGYEPCTRHWPHSGPCAHPPKGPHMRAHDGPFNGERLGTQVTIDWYDGPLRSLRLVQFPDGDRMVQVNTILATVGEPFTIGRDDNVRDVMVRFDRNELQMMLDVLDGKPIPDWHDRPTVSQVDDEET